MTRLTLLAILAVCLTAGAARADTAATADLAAQLERISHLQGKFEQRQFGAGSDELVGTSRGAFKLLRPGYFSWEIEVPDSQIIIADLEHLWHHDRDLETVTRRPVAGREELSPLQVLGGDTEMLENGFEVTVEGDGRYRLEPVDSNPGFRSLLLILVNGQPRGMEVLDSLNQRLVISFSEVDGDTVLTPVDFRFVPPEGADLFYYDQ